MYDPREPDYVVLASLGDTSYYYAFIAFGAAVAVALFGYGIRSWRWR